MIKYLALPLILVGCTAPVTDPPAHAFEVVVGIMYTEQSNILKQVKERKR